MKKLISLMLILALFMLSALVSCGGADQTASEDESSEETASSANESEPSVEVSENSENSEDPAPIDYPREMAYNIAMGKPYTVVTTSFRTDDFGDADDENGVKLRGKLTDGIAAPNGDNNAVAGYGSDSLIVTINLGEKSRIYGFSADCYGNQWGIANPENTVVEYFISDDGINFTSCAKVSPNLGNAAVFYVNGWAGCNYTFNLENPVDAAYVRVTYQVAGEHIWSSEINVLGFDDSFSENMGANGIPRVYIATQNNDRVHRSEYYPCSILVYDPSGAYKNVSDPNGEIKIRGNSTSGGQKAPYNIRFENKEDLFGMGKCKKWYLLANMYDKTQIRNKLSFGFADDIGMAYVQQSVFVELYLNGAYKGIYQLCESIGVGDTRVDIDITGNEFLLEYEPWEQYSNPEWYRTPICGILLGFNDPESPSTEQRSYIETFFRAAEKAIQSHNFKRISEYIDVQSFVDAYIVQEFFKQVDYATSSTRFYIKDGKLYEGPVWDFDLSSGNCSSAYYVDYNNVNGSGNSWEGWQCFGLWNSRLFACNEFRQAVIDRYKELQPYIVNIYEDNELGKNRINALLDKYSGDIEKNYTIWSLTDIYSDLERIPSDGTYEGEINYLRNWLKNRNAWILEQYGLK